MTHTTPQLEYKELLARKSMGGGYNSLGFFGKAQFAYKKTRNEDKMSNCASFLFRFASQIVSLGAFSSKIYSHITPLGVFSGKIFIHVTCPRRFRAEFVLKLSRPVCFWAEFVLACSAWSVFMQNFFSHCVAGHVLSQGFALLPSFRLLARLAFLSLRGKKHENSLKFSKKHKSGGFYGKSCKGKRKGFRDGA